MIIHKFFPSKTEDSIIDNQRFLIQMVTSYSIFLFCIVALSFFLYISTGKNMQNQFRQQNQSLLYSSNLLMEKDLSVMEVFSRQLLQDNTFMRLLNASGPQTPDFYLNGFSVRQDLATNIYPEVFLPIEEYYVHFENSGYLLNASHFVERSLFYSGSRSYPLSLFDEWVDYLENEDYYNTLISLDRFTNSPALDYYLYVIDLDALSERKLNATTCFIVDGKKLSMLFNGIELYDTGFLVITDNTGKTLFSMSDTDTGIDFHEFDANALRDLSYQEDCADWFYEGRHMLVTKQAAVFNNWHFYLVQPAEAALLNFRSYQILFFVFLTFAVAIGVYLIALFSQRSFRPFVALGQELQVAVDTTLQLQEEVDKQRPIICNTYVRQLMLGTISSAPEVAYIKDYLGLQGENLYYNVLYAVVYNNENEDEGSHGIPVEDENMFSTVLDAMNTYLGEPLLRYSPTDRTYALLLACGEKDADSFIMRMQEIVLKLHDYLLDEHSIWFFAGIGHNTDSLMNVWESYQQAQEAINYATRNYIFLPYEIIRKDSNVYYYPSELSTKLIHFITSGNEQQVLEIFSLIHQENIEERSLPIHLLKYLLSDIRNTLLKARFALPSGTSKALSDALDSRFEEHLSFKLCEDIAMALCGMFHSDATTDTSLASTIEKYILANYKDPSLCLNKISDEFQISESYFSHMFKEKTGINFSNYLEKVRMSEASRLIRETDTNLSELYLIVGYNNVTSFRRVFKKTFGITPSAMRENAKQTG